MRNSSCAYSLARRPTVTSWKATTSTRPDSFDAKKSARHRRRPAGWRGKVKRVRSVRSSSW